MLGGFHGRNELALPYVMGVQWILSFVWPTGSGYLRSWWTVRDGREIDSEIFLNGLPVHGQPLIELVEPVDYIEHLEDLFPPGSGTKLDRFRRSRLRITCNEVVSEHGAQPFTHDCGRKFWFVFGDLRGVGYALG